MKVITVLVSVLVAIGATVTATASAAAPAASAAPPGDATASASASVSVSVSAIRSSTAQNPVWLWPLVPPHTVVSGFEAPLTAYASGHRGIDIASRPGEAVYAPSAGVVSFAGRVVDRGVLTLAIDGDLLASVEPVIPLVTAGERVVAGQVIATVDSGGPESGGHCAARCLHLGVRLHGGYVSPLRFLGGVPLAILLPVDDALSSSD